MASIKAESLLTNDKEWVRKFAKFLILNPHYDIFFVSTFHREIELLDMRTGKIVLIICNISFPSLEDYWTISIMVM